MKKGALEYLRYTKIATAIATFGCSSSSSSSSSSRAEAEERKGPRRAATSKAHRCSLHVGIARTLALVRACLSLSLSRNR